VVQDGSSTITNTVVERSGAFGLFLGSAGSAEVSVTGSTFRDNVATAINVQTNAALTSVQSTEFRNNDTGVYFNNTDATYTINSNCVFKGNDVAIYSSGYANPVPSIVSCVIDSNGTGVQTNNYSHPILIENQVTHNDAGLLAGNGSAPLIRSNVFRNNDDGILAFTNAEPDAGTYASAGNNTIQYSANYHIVNLSPSVTVYAINNWYGNKGPKPTKFLGDVVWEPYLSGDDPNAAPGGEVVDPGVEERRISGSRIVACVPNPMNPTTTIRYELASPGVVDISIYNVRGQRIRQLVNEPTSAGAHEVAWRGLDDVGRRVASSVYFVKMTTGSLTETRKLTVLK
jgi:parallel beta-helix repeat protein